MHIGTGRHSLIIVAVLTGALAACGGSGEKSKTQVVARVNGEEITVIQLNQVLGALGPHAGANSDDAGRNALEDMINKTIGVQAAIRMKLDREPEILQAIESAKRSVLLDAYLERALRKPAFPTPSEVHAYFSQHPELFANRRIYVFNQLTAFAGRKSAASLNRKVTAVSNLNEFVSWLRDNGVEYSLVSDVRPSEQLPPGMLAQLQKLKAGDLGYLAASDGVVVIELAQVFDKPLSEQQAQQLIERHLANEMQVAEARRVLQQLRAQSKVEYLGKFEAEANPQHATPPQAEMPPPTPQQSPLPRSDGRHIEISLHGSGSLRQTDTGGHLGAR